MKPIEMAASSATFSLFAAPPIPRITSSSLSFSSFKSSFFNIPALLTRKSKTHRGLVVDQSRTRTQRRGVSCYCLFGLGVPELVVIAGVAALVFGPKKLPEVGKSIGKTVKSFQQAAKEFESELKKEPDSAAEPRVEESTTVGEAEKEDLKVSSTKEIS